MDRFFLALIWQATEMYVQVDMTAPNASHEVTHMVKKINRP